MKNILQARALFSKLGFGFIALVILMTGCKPSLYQDDSDTVSTQLLTTQQGDYKSVAWLDDDHIAFIYRPDDLIVNDLDIDFRVDILDISSGKIETLPQIPLCHLVVFLNQVVFMRLPKSLMVPWDLCFAVILIRE